MLREISIRNIATIESINIQFEKGFTLLTGETGAGKSIIIDAVALLLGSRGGANLIRTGETDASVEALFDISDLPQLKNEIELAGFEAEDDLVVKRVVSLSGKNRCYINGSLSNLSTLSAVASQLINIYGQHESQTLLKSENHLKLLDKFSAASEIAANFAEIFQNLNKVVTEIEEIERGSREAAQRLDILEYQYREIDDANLKPDEEVDLEEEKLIVANSEKLFNTTNSSFAILYDDDDALLSRVNRVAADVENLSKIDPHLASVASTLKDAAMAIEEGAFSLRDYAAKIESNPSRLEEINERLDLIYRLKRKYGSTIKDVIDYKEGIQKDIEKLQNLETDKERLEEDRRSLKAQLKRVGADLTAKRFEGAKLLSKQIESEIQQLSMDGASISFCFNSVTNPTSSGYETGEFLFAPNRGEDLKPLAKIASGGELSRIMLSFKQALPESGVPTLIFDEIDTGISGATSAIIGKKLRSAAANRQIICITHIPQVASNGDNHLKISKKVVDGRTFTSIEYLDADCRIREVARLLAGEVVTESAILHAADMINSNSRHLH